MSIDLFGIRIKISFAAALFFAAAFNVSFADRYIISIVSALFHEMIHLIFILICGCRNITADIHPGGICISADGLRELNCGKTALCALSAPAVNLITAGALYVIYTKNGNGTLYGISGINFIIGAVNLLPLRFLDGGRAMECLLIAKLKNGDPDFIMNSVQTICAGLMGVVLITLTVLGKGSLLMYVFYFYCVYNIIQIKMNKNGH